MRLHSCRSLAADLRLLALGRTSQCAGAQGWHTGADMALNARYTKCQSATRERWLADRQADLLPVPYFHVVFTIPAEVAAIAFNGCNA
jgi:hypothetical protein